LLRLWLIIPPKDVKAAARSVQQSFRELDWIAPVPAYFLHVSAGAGATDWASVAPFPITYRRANSFHDAVIVEAHADGPFPPSPFLPHLSIGYFRRPESADRLRDVLPPFRDVELGTGIVDEVVLCDVPIGKTTFFQPWRVVTTLRLGG
jgi:2'-5' RNA ligase